MDLVLFAKRKLKELRHEKLKILSENEKVPTSLLAEIKYHREVVRMAIQLDQVE